MNYEYNFKNEEGKIINISFLGFFKIQELEKEYIMYSLVNQDDDSSYGNILLGEVVRLDNNDIQILGINESEIDLVVAYYNEISSQIGGE